MFISVSCIPCLHFPIHFPNKNCIPFLSLLDMNFVNTLYLQSINEIIQRIIQEIIAFISLLAFL